MIGLIPLLIEEPSIPMFSNHRNFANPQTLKPSKGELPLDKLRRPDPILFFDEVDLYEDELGDNGMSLLSIKVRVMPTRLLLLSRFFLRLDDVIFRVRDTRVYVEFETGEVMRDYCVMEGAYAKLKEVRKSVDLTNIFRWSLIRRILVNSLGMLIG